MNRVLIHTAAHTWPIRSSVRSAIFVGPNRQNDQVPEGRHQRMQPIYAAPDGAWENDFWFRGYKDVAPDGAVSAGTGSGFPLGRNNQTSIRRTRQSNRPVLRSELNRKLVALKDTFRCLFDSLHVVVSNED